MTITCVTCSEELPSTPKYFSHQWIHRHTPNITFPCPFPSCGMVLSRYKNLIAHKRSHIRRPFYVVRQDEDTTFAKCTSSGCSFIASSPILFLNHMETHMRSGQSAYCFCGHYCRARSTLTTHFKRKHSKLVSNHSNQTFLVCDLELGGTSVNAAESADTFMMDVSHEPTAVPDLGTPVCFDGVLQTLRGCVVGISSDNLEAHTLGGFNQTFSSVDYYCRFCYARKAQRIRGNVAL